MKALDEVVLDHYALGLLDIDDAALADQAAEMACRPGELAGVMRRLVDAELTARAAETEPTPQRHADAPIRPVADPPQLPPRGPRIVDELGERHDRGDLDERVDVPVGVELWAITGRTPRDIVEVTPETCGAADDPVACALHALGQFGDLTPTLAAQMLGMWIRRDELTAGQVAEVLAYYRPATLRAVA